MTKCLTTGSKATVLKCGHQLFSWIQKQK